MVNRRQINGLVRHIAEGFRPEKIIVFGSYAYGTPTEDSDVDLLVILKTREDVVEKAAEIYVSADKAKIAPFSVDILVRTPEQVRKRIALNDFFMREIIEKGKVLYDASDPGVGRQGGKGFPQRTTRISRSKRPQLR